MGIAVDTDSHVGEVFDYHWSTAYNLLSMYLECHTSYKPSSTHRLNLQKVDNFTLFISILFIALACRS
jgi:hypothetical protein